MSLTSSGTNDKHNEFIRTASLPHDTGVNDMELSCTIILSGLWDECQTHRTEQSEHHTAFKEAVGLTFDLFVGEII